MVINATGLVIGGRKCSRLVIGGHKCRPCMASFVRFPAKPRHRGTINHVALCAFGLCCLLLDARGRQTYQPVRQLSATAQPDATCKNFRTDTDSQCIASSGLIPEPLLTHDPSRSRFRVYFKSCCTALSLGFRVTRQPICVVQLTRHAMLQRDWQATSNQ